MSKALVVDDARTARLVCRKIVESLGMDVVEADNGQVALEQMQDNPDVELVLLDWNMPVMDGLTCLKEMRGNSGAPQPKVIMCTTENEMDRIASAIQAGCDEYIIKPFTEDIVREKISLVRSA